MKTNLKQITLIALVLLFALDACKQGTKFTYPQDESISNNAGIPKKRYMNYFPIEAAAKTNSETTFDTFHIKLYSKILFKIGEPILYNYYIGKPVIRLTWIAPSGYPMTLSVEEIDNKVQLKENGFAPLTEAYKAKHPKDTCERVYRAKAMNFDQKQKLIDLLKKVKFFDMPTNLNEKPSKGTELAIEYHDQSNYHLAYRTITDPAAPSDFKSICDYIIDLSNFKADKRY